MFDILNYINSLPTDTTVIDVSNKNLTTIPPLTRFYQLKTFICSRNSLTELPLLPNSLKGLFCDSNRLTTLPTLPDSLIVLICSINQLDKLPNLSPSLKYLYCGFNYLTTLPTLPPQLNELSCINNYLIELPNLPQQLQKFYCGSNFLTIIPKLPNTITELSCECNQLYMLPTLPCNLHTLVTNNNLLPNQLVHVGKISVNGIIVINKCIQSITNVQYIIWSIKCKKPLRALLWTKIRFPKIQQQQYHPDNLKQLLINNSTDDLERIISNW